jgi:hypothetical protein
LHISIFSFKDEIHRGLSGMVSKWISTHSTEFSGDFIGRILARNTASSPLSKEGGFTVNVTFTPLDYPDVNIRKRRPTTSDDLVLQSGG